MSDLDQAKAIILKAYSSALNFWQDDYLWTVEVTAIQEADGRVEAVVTATSKIYPQEERFAARYDYPTKLVYFCYGEDDETPVTAEFLYMELWYRIHRRLKVAEKKLLELPQE